MVSVRLADHAVLLEPATTLNELTETARADWTKPAKSSLPTAFKAEPVDSSEAVVTAGTVISRWQAWLPGDWDGRVTPAWRIRWDGLDYEIDGEIGRWKKGTSVRYLTCILKRVAG